MRRSASIVLLLAGLFAPPAHACPMSGPSLCAPPASVPAAPSRPSCHASPAQKKEGSRCPGMLCCLSSPDARSAVDRVEAGDSRRSLDPAPAASDAFPRDATPVFSAAPQADPPPGVRLFLGSPSFLRGPPALG